MQENDENTVNQKDEMPSQDTAHEYPDQEGASVPAENDGNESRSRPNRGKQILRAVTEVAGVEDVYETVAVIVKKDENVTPKEKRKKVLDAVLKVTGVRGAYNDVKEVFKRRNKEKNAEETPEKPDKKTKRKNVFKRIVQAVKLACKAGIFVCKCLMKVVGPGVYVIEKILEKTLVVAKTTYKAIKADDKKERREILINGAVELIGWDGKTGKLQKKFQNAAKTVHTVSGAVSSIAKEPNVDGLIGAAVIIGKDAVSDTKVGRIADDVNKYGEKLNNELRQNETENKPSVSPVTNAADNRETAAPAESEENIVVAAAEINMENITEITVRPETQTKNTNTQADTVLPETVAEEFKNNMISGHQRLQEVRAKIAARKNSTEDNPQTAADDIALIRSLRTRPARQTVIRRPQNFSAERMMLLQAMQRC